MPGPGDPRYEFHRVFYETKKGRIIGLATRRDNVRDGLAMTLVGRNFPLPEFENIDAEPSRTSVLPAENVIFIGEASHFLAAAAAKARGRDPNIPIGAIYASRIRSLLGVACYVHERDGRRHIRNTVTGECYVPESGPDIERDYAVIRRAFRGPDENTIMLEGVHRLGTLGAAKVLSSQTFLAAIWDAVQKLKGFDDRLLLEILIEVTFEPKHNQGVYAASTIQVKTLAIVFDRQWICDMREAPVWANQTPWDLYIEAAHDEAARSVSAPLASSSAAPLPRLEFQADLRGADAGVRGLCAQVLGKGPLPKVGEPCRIAEDAEHLLEALTRESERFHIDLFETPLLSKMRPKRLPDGPPTQIRSIRKQFLLHLVLCRLLGLQFHYDEGSIRRFFPGFVRVDPTKTLEEQFVSSVRGRLREGFGPLLGDARSPKGYVEIETDKRNRGYRLRLVGITLILKIRV